MIVKVLWERNAKLVNNKLCVPKNIVHISANVSPKDAKLVGANESKVKFVATGSRALRHENKMMLGNLMEQAATKLHEYLPVMASLSLKCSLATITDQEIKSYEGILKVEQDEREGN